MRAKSALGLLLLSSTAQASMVDFQFGTPDFIDGAIANTATFSVNPSGDPDPFNRLIGGDAVANAAFNLPLNYGALPGPIASASLTLSTWDFDSMATGPQVGSFTVGGVDLTAALNTLAEATPASQSQVRIYEITLPPSTFATLASGSVEVSIALIPPGLGVLGDTPFNGGGLDFARVSILIVPEPVGLTLAAVVPLLVRRRPTAR